MEALDLSRLRPRAVELSSAWAHGVLPSDDAVHVCYCHNPFRYAWNAREATLRAPRRRSRGPRWASVLPALAPVGLDRRPARRPLRRELRDDAPARSRATSPARPTVVYPPVEIERFTPGDAGRPLRRPLRADAAQAHRARGAGVQRAAPAARRHRRRARRAAPAAPGRADRALHRPRQRRGGRAAAGDLPRARRHRDRGVRHRRGRGAGRRAAGHRAATRAA